MSLSKANTIKMNLLQNSVDEVDRYRRVLVQAILAVEKDELEGSRLAGRLRRRSLDLSENLVELRKS